MRRFDFNAGGDFFFNARQIAQTLCSAAIQPSRAAGIP
jgi:hypothetical protein